MPVKDWYDTALSGTTFVRPLTTTEASFLIHGGKGKCYNSKMADTLLNEPGKTSAAINSASELKLRSWQMKPDMNPARDLMMRKGEKLLSKVYVLTKQIIDQIRDFERMDRYPHYDLTVWANKHG